MIDDVIVTGWRQRPNGVKYVAWDHPLSPTYKDVRGGGWLAVHPQRGGIDYRHWVALALGDQAGSRRPARCIADWQRRLRNVPRQVRHNARMLAGGFDMDNMKARAFSESEMPLPGTDPDVAAALSMLARGLVDAAEVAARALRFAVRAARYSRDTSTDTAPLASVYEAFWTATEGAFFELLREAASADGETALQATGVRWHSILRASALTLFDQVAPLDPFAASFDPRRIVEARRNLFGTLEGRGAQGIKLFESLLLPASEHRLNRRQAEAEEVA
jgi:CRISPR system Cascade subunit CasA